jgi:hypothetical protein
MPVWSFIQKEAEFNDDGTLKQGWEEYVDSYGESGYRRMTHVGLVLGLSERNGYHDSDFYAYVWNWEKQEPEEIFYATTRFPSTGANAVVDATAEVVAAYDAYRAKKAEQKAAAQAVEDAKQIAVGKKVVVARGRKVPKGTVGKVIWLGQGDWGWRAGVATSEKKDATGKYADVVWTAAKNLDVVL